MRLNLLLPQVQDSVVRENFQRIQDFTKQNNQLDNFKHLELVFNSAITNYRHKHGFTFIPKDVILTSSTGPGAATFNYTLFDKDFIDITTSGAVTIRFFLGTAGGII